MEGLKGRKARVFSVEFKQQAARRLLAGESGTALSRELEVKRSVPLTESRTTGWWPGGAEVLEPTEDPRGPDRKTGERVPGTRPRCSDRAVRLS